MQLIKREILYTNENSLKYRWPGNKDKMKNSVLGAAIVLKMLITCMYNENDEVPWSKENE